MTSCPLYIVYVGGRDDGIDELETQMDPDVPIDADSSINRAKVMLQRQGLLVSAVPKSDVLADDYDPNWILDAHPSSFPYHTGSWPEGMSMERWSKCIMHRYPPSQFAQNLGLISDLFNITQRHSVSKSAWIQFRCRPDQSASIGSLSEADVQSTLDAITNRAYGEGLNLILNALPPAARTLYNGLKAVGGRVIGTPQSFAALRSKVIAATNLHGSYTCQLNLSPAEIGSEWTFRLAGEDYNIALDGRPTNRPHVTQCKRIIAANPMACADFLMAYLRAFTEIFLGWPMDSDHQVDPDCFFGKIYAAYLKYESSQRGGLHAHGQIIQKFLQTEALQRLLREGVFTEQLFGFFEGLMCAYFPVPQVPPTYHQPNFEHMPFTFPGMYRDRVCKAPVSVGKAPVSVGKAPVWDPT
jgi:Helitron helicase-like domain at N-terminus